MMVRLVVLVFSMIVAVGAVAAPTEMRTWTDARGLQVQARALSYDGNSVELEFASGETQTLPASNLSLPDQEYLEQHFRGEASGDSEEGDAAEEEEARSFGLIPLGLIVLGWIVFAVGAVWFLVVAFQESVGWGLGCFVPVVPLIFLISHWQEAKKPFGVEVLGVAIVFLGAAIGTITALAG